jgi:hypothetical protein
MQFLKRSLGLGVLLVMVIVLGHGAAFAAQETIITPTSTGQEGSGVELTQTLEWPEMGLTMDYPEGWQLGFDQNFDFVLFGPQEAEDDSFPYIIAQSSLLPGGQSFSETMDQIAGDSTDELSEGSFAGIEGLEFSEVNEEREQHIRYLGFPFADNQFGLFVFVTPMAEQEEWSPVFTDIQEAAVIEPLTLDHELLNEQLQENFNETGLLTVGEPDAPVWMVEHMDFSCGHCATFSRLLDRIVQDQVTGENNVRLTINVLDIIGGELSRSAAAAQLCGVQLGVGWDMHSLIFERYLEDGRDAYSTENLLQAVEESELDVDTGELEACMATDAIDEQIDENVNWARELGVNSTPTLMFAVEGGELGIVEIQSNVPLSNGVPLMFMYEYFEESAAAAEDATETETEE